MLSLTSPLWLLALLAMPLVWWLHRWHDVGDHVPVAARFLWAAGLESGESGRLARRPQAIWLLRALLLAVLVLALCGPRWSTERAPALTVWLDDSVSMFTAEQGGTRLHVALSILEEALSAGAYGPVTLRSLGAPGQVLQLQGSHWATQLRAFAPHPRGEPQLPAPALLPRDRVHWLVTDGASDGVVRWAGLAPLSRLVQVGSIRENVGVAGMALRRDGAGAAQLSVTLRNGGVRPATRHLTLTAGHEQLATMEVSVDGGGNQVQILTLDSVPMASLEARISPADALPLDDHLAIPYTALQTPAVSFSGPCGPHLRSAVVTHPGLSEAGSGQPADLTVHCGSAAPNLPGPALVLADAPLSVPLQDAILWHVQSGALRDIALQPDWLAAPAGVDSAAPDAGVVLLSAGARPLITHDHQRQLMFVDLDFSQPALVRQPEYPLLVAALVERLLGVEEAPGEIVARGQPAPVLIAPRRLPAGATTPLEQSRMAPRELAPVLIVAALCLLLADLVLLLSRRRRPRRPQRAQAVAGA